LSLRPQATTLPSLSTASTLPPPPETATRLLWASPEA